MLIMSHNGIDSIFKKEGRHYNKKARLYQDILIFGSILEENQSFKLWDLAKYLLDKNEEFRSRYSQEKLKNANKIENIQRRIKRSIESLVNLRLIKSTGQVKEERGSGFVPTYCYTRSGYLISQVIQCVINGGENAEEQLYNLFQRSFKVEDHSPSWLIFNSKFIEKIHNKNLFGEYVSVFQKALDSKEITNIESFARVIQNHISPLFQRRLFVRAWEETVDELEPQIRRLYMYEQKLAIDVKMGSKALNREYEELRLELMENVEEVALEGVCTACNQRSAFQMLIIEYTTRLANAHILRPFIKCPKCDVSERTLRLPILWL